MNNLSKKERINMVYSSLRENGEIHNQAELAKAIGASEATISKALKGEERALTDNLFKRISKRFVRYSLDWMVKGEGAMCCSTASDAEIFGEERQSSEISKDERIKFLEEKVAFLQEQVEFYKNKK